MLVLELPDIHERWPFAASYNRQEAATSAESIAWIESLGVLSDRRLKQFKLADFGGLASIAYSHFTHADHYRVACDMINLLFVFDDFSDPLSPQSALNIAATSLDALRNWETPTPYGEHPIVEMHRSFSKRLHRVSRSDILDKFVANYDGYLKAVATEAKDRDNKTPRSTLASYLALRRETGAVTCCFNLLLIPYEIPDDILRDSRIKHLETLGLDLVCVGNDILSFNVEHARGDTHNAVFVVMHEHGLSIQDAMDFVGRWYRGKVEDFCTAMRDLPPCSSLYTRHHVKMYATGIANWVTANYEWSLRSSRSPGVKQLT
ncbi:isoprenoid synthase domain-containing protein [Mycena sanguinolenta]|nr:isoprenoid synthase domain-containing protein [Mycena sanguinolenta]